VIGIGTDLVDVERFRTALERTPSMVDRLFTDDEQAYATGRRDPAEHLAARFAAKEATMKAMGLGLGSMRFQEIEVIRASSGEPSLRLHASAAALARDRGVARWLLTLTHTHLSAHAIAVALGVDS
jgi:holo-[acyl-carrier protein] synthase